jgi:hypothetical protein
MDDKPFAAVINLDDEDTQEILLMASCLRARMSTRSIRSQAHKDGLSKMTLREVNALIRKTHAERQR